MYRTPKGHPLRQMHDALPQPLTSLADAGRLRRYVPPPDDGLGRWEVNYDAQTNDGAFIKLRTYNLKDRNGAQYIIDYQAIETVRKADEDESHGGIMSSAIHIRGYDAPLFLVHTPREVMTLIATAHSKIKSKDKGSIRASRIFTADEVQAGEHTIPNEPFEKE